MSFEVCETDGFSRVGVLKTRHGDVGTPAVFPVHNIGANAGWNTPPYWRTFPQINTAMFNASYLHMDKRHRLPQILKGGIHKFLNFRGAAFVDSGGFLYKKYKLTVSQEDILKIQEKAGADIASSLDYPIEISRRPRDQNISLAVRNAKEAIRKRKDERMLLFASIHGYDPTVIRNVIRHLSKHADFDGFALGSLVPIYTNFKLLVNLVYAARKELPREKPLHVYGLTGYLVGALLIYLGVDSIDSSTFIIAASKRDYLVPGYRRVSIHRIKEMGRAPCECKVCKKHPVSKVLSSRKLLSIHNLWVLWDELQHMKTAIKENSLEHILEEKFSRHKWGQVAFNYAKNRRKYGSRRG